LRQLTPQVASEQVHLFDPADPRLSIDPGVTVTYQLTRPVDDAKLEFVDEGGRTMGRIDDAPPSAGMHRLLWRPTSENGSFTVRLTAGGQSATQAVTVTPGPSRTDGAFGESEEPAPAAPAPQQRASQGSFQLFDPTDPTRLVDPGVTVYYSLAEQADEATLEFLDRRGNVIRSFSGDQVPTTPGQHSFLWNLRYPGPTLFEGLSMPFASTNGPRAPWGRYSVRLTVDGESQRQSFEIRGDPRLRGVGPGQIREQFRLAMRVRDRTSEANEGVIGIRDCYAQIDDRIQKANDDEVTRAGNRLKRDVGVVERALYQTELVPGVSWEGVEPLRLNTEIAYLLGLIESAESRPTESTYAVFNLLSQRLDHRLSELDALFDEDVAGFNRLLGEHDLEPISCGRGGA
jgi:hypothetical protein